MAFNEKAFARENPDLQMKLVDCDIETLRDIAEAAAFLVPLADASYRTPGSKWGVLPMAWLIMVRDSIGAMAQSDEEKASHH